MTVSWLARQRAAATAEVALVCVPHAGGGASGFHGWGAALGAGIEVHTAALPGRERRFAEPARSSMARVADPLAEAVAALPLPVVLFGHSMGGLIGLEVAHRLTAAGRPPAALIVAGTPAPGRRLSARLVSTMDDDRLVEWLGDLGGLPAEVLDDRHLLGLLLPTVRADLLLCETYRYRAAAPLTCPVHAFAGADDVFAPAADMAGWAAVTTGAFHRRELPGGHFFVRDARAEVTAAVRDACTPLTHREPALAATAADPLDTTTGEG
jgi:surfactin synthase thioesterase subunit